MAHRELMLTLNLEDLELQGRPGQLGMEGLPQLGFSIIIMASQHLMFFISAWRKLQVKQLRSQPRNQRDLVQIPCPPLVLVQRFSILCVSITQTALKLCTSRLHPRASGYILQSLGVEHRCGYFLKVSPDPGTDSHIGNYWSGESVEKLTSSVAVLPHQFK